MKIKTKAYQSTVREEEIRFTNYERVDEEMLFEIILKRLNDIPNVKVGKKEMGPSEDYYKCLIGQHPFVLFYDIDYGTSIYAESKTAREMIIHYFNE